MGIMLEAYSRNEPSLTYPPRKVTNGNAVMKRKGMIFCLESWQFDSATLLTAHIAFGYFVWLHDHCATTIYSLVIIPLLSLLMHHYV